jgi:arsenite transporter
MSETAAVAGKAPSLGKFERFLTLWVMLCIIVGIGLGQAVHGVFHALGAWRKSNCRSPCWSG